MSKIVLTRKAGAVAGALYGYLAPRMAADSKVDLTPILKDVTQKNFKDQKARIAADVKKGVKLATDANLDDLTTLLDKLEPMEVAEGADEDPNSGLPMGKEDMDKKAKDEAEAETKVKAEKDAKDKKAKDKKAKDAKRRARDAKMDEIKKGLDAAACKALDEMMDDMDAEDGESEAAEKDAEGKDKRAKDAEPVTAKAMDEALKRVAEETEVRVLKTQREIAEAREAVRPYVGAIALACDSKASVYKAALNALNISTKDMHVDAYPAVLAAQRTIDQRSRRDSRLANDGANATDPNSFDQMFPNAGRIANLG